MIIAPRASHAVIPPQRRPLISWRNRTSAAYTGLNICSRRISPEIPNRARSLWAGLVDVVPGPRYSFGPSEAELDMGLGPTQAGRLLRGVPCAWRTKAGECLLSCVLCHSLPALRSSLRPNLPPAAPLRHAHACTLPSLLNEEQINRERPVRAFMDGGLLPGEIRQG